MYIWVASILGAIINNAALNIPIQIFIGTNVFISLGYVLRVELLGLLVTLFNILRNCQTFFQTVPL